MHRLKSVYQRIENLLNGFTGKVTDVILYQRDVGNLRKILLPIHGKVVAAITRNERGSGATFQSLLFR